MPAPAISAAPAPAGQVAAAPAAADATVRFSELGLHASILRNLDAAGYTTPSPIQAAAIPHLLQGRDLIGIAQTGTGKTAAFALPLLHRLASNAQPASPCRPRALILTPTRELAAQIADSLAKYGRSLRISHALVFGGVGQFPQVRALRSGPDIVVATPGRLLDLMGQGHVRLDRIEAFVLDEADRMLDLGFAPDVRRIVGTLPARRQSLLFSATLPGEIREIASSLLTDPAHVAVTPVASTAERVEQRVCHVNRADKHGLLVHLLGRHPEGLALVFARTKHGADRLAKNLDRDGIRAAAIHGDKSQGARTRALEDFRCGRTRVLVATDLAARGIDVRGIEVVINFDMPVEAESYVHRIGRTARAGRSGLAYSLCDHEERGSLRSIERLIRLSIEVVADHPFPAPVPEPTRPGGNGGPAFRGGFRRRRHFGR